MQVLPVWRNVREFLNFSLRRKNYSALLGGPFRWECSFGRGFTDFRTQFSKARHSLGNCKNEYMVLELENEAAAQAVIGSIVWAFRRLSYILHMLYVKFYSLVIFYI